MKKLICIGILLVVAGCAPVLSNGQPVESKAKEGWYDPQKTDLQLSQDLKECQNRCLTA